MTILRSLAVASAAWTALSFQWETFAQTPYPNKPVRVMVGLAPGGLADTQARLFSQKLSETLGQQFIVDNRAGAGGLIAYQTVSNAMADGYTLLGSSPGITILPAFREKPPYDPVKDFAPVSLITTGPYLVVAHPSLPVKSMTELMDFARTKPDALNWSFYGVGSNIHLGAVWLMSVAKIKMTLVPYKGGSLAYTALMSGEVHASFASPVLALAHVKSGKMRALAITSAKRSPILPNLPTVAESGVPGFDFATWHGWFAPKNTPAPIVKKLSAALARAARAPELADKLASDGSEPVGNTPEQFLKLVAEESARWRKLVRESGMPLEK